MCLDAFVRGRTRGTGLEVWHVSGLVNARGKGWLALRAQRNRVNRGERGARSQEE